MLGIRVWMDRSLDHAQERSGCCCRGRSRAGRGGAGRVATTGAGVRPDNVRMLMVVLELDLVLHFVAGVIFVVIVLIVVVFIVVVVVVHIVAARAVHSVVAAYHRLRLLRLPLLYHLLHDFLWLLRCRGRAAAEADEHAGCSAAVARLRLHAPGAVL
uniref:Uncharacterized protein n=1 Tax=Zea mays TaxID=4577 RepID=C4JAD2_MAIZE|nr:unknown [Zea mays]